MKEPNRIYHKGRESFPIAIVIKNNIVILLWLILGTIGCWFISPAIATAYLLIGSSMIYVVLRKLVCTNCYYYGKLCHTGWGKLAALIFKKGDISKFKESIGVKIAPVTYGALSLIPLIMIVISMHYKFTLYKLIVFGLIFGLSIESGIFSRRISCANCKMRNICPGCAVKKKG